MAAPSSSLKSQDPWVQLVEECFRREAGASEPIPNETVDLIQAGILDSMAWVGFLRSVETASGVSDLGGALNDQPASLAAVLSALRDSKGRASPNSDAITEDVRISSGRLTVITGSSLALGSKVVPSEEVDRAFGMPSGKLRHRAGIESLAYAAEGESELTLGARAAEEALRGASCGAHELDWIIATSETHHNYPSLAAQLHSRLLVRENCGALDVGGACLGLLNALAAANALIGSGSARKIVVVTADVHSRTLTPGRVAGEFGGLFGDGATAFLLHAANGGESNFGYRLGEFLFGCAGQYAAAIQVSDDLEGGLAVQFDGDALSRAAIARLEKIISALELRSGIPRGEVGYFATHQPNPRLLTLLAKQSGVSPEAFSPICRTSGNLGSSMCAAALHSALQSASQLLVGERKPIFLASLGPGLLFGGSWLTPT
ncbi:MAG TPA: 3-oxoacyl-[acyl-carrier-protein] synthase III C-terminal domain-containing protein [Candidatus Acidoferrum sp.]|nr:3-oxoacyl-[acyl-carrier-protein] synthase III C-terminal domain-containing protein [Candidatus Acidoferrum sp.]